MGDEGGRKVRGQKVLSCLWGHRIAVISGGGWHSQGFRHLRHGCSGGTIDSTQSELSLEGSVRGSRACWDSAWFHGWRE